MSVLMALGILIGCCMISVGLFMSVLLAYWLTLSHDKPPAILAVVISVLVGPPLAAWIATAVAVILRALKE